MKHKRWILKTLDGGAGCPPFFILEKIMASGKNSFVLYKDLLSTFQMLTNDEAGKLIKHLLLYVNDEEPVLEDRMLSILFQPIKEQLKRDLRSWETIKEKRSMAGKLGGRGNKKQKKQVLLNKAKKAVTVTVTDSVTVNDNNSIGGNKFAQSESFDLFWKAYPNKKGKKKAIDYFKKKIKNEDKYNELITGLNGYITHHETLQGSGKFCPEYQQGDTFLSKETWLDYFDTENLVGDDFYKTEIERLRGTDYGGQFRAKYGAELHDIWRTRYKQKTFNESIGR